MVTEPLGDFVPFTEGLRLCDENLLGVSEAPWGGLSEPSGPSPSACEASGPVVDTSAMFMKVVSGIVRDAEEKMCG